MEEKGIKLREMDLKTAKKISKEDLGDYDFLEIVGFMHKANYEGFDYAAREYPPRFKRDGYSYTEDREVLEVLLKRFEKPVAAFNAREDAWDVFNKHVDESNVHLLG